NPHVIRMRSTRASFGTRNAMKPPARSPVFPFHAVSLFLSIRCSGKSRGLSTVEDTAIRESVHAKRDMSPCASPASVSVDAVTLASALLEGIALVAVMMGAVVVAVLSLSHAVKQTIATHAHAIRALIARWCHAAEKDMERKRWAAGSDSAREKWG